MSRAIPLIIYFVNFTDRMQAIDPNFGALDFYFRAVDAKGSAATTRQTRYIDDVFSFMYGSTAIYPECTAWIVRNLLNYVNVPHPGRYTISVTVGFRRSSDANDAVPLTSNAIALDVAP